MATKKGDNESKFNKKQYDIDYHKNNTKRFAFSLNINLDADMINFVESKRPVQTYIKKLIREDMEKEKAEN